MIAHRGLSGLCPENTLAAFDAAVAAGASMVELDVTTSADGALMVIHDATLDRTTDGKGPVAALSRAALGRLDAGSWFAPEFAGEPIPTLETVFSRLRGRALVNVEIKREAVTPAVAGGVVERVIETAHDHGMAASIVVSSFEPRALEQAREVDTRVPRAVLFDEERYASLDPEPILDAFEACSLNLSRERVTRGVVEACHARGRLVLVHTVNEPEAMVKTFDLGVDGIFTDRVDLALDLPDPPVSNSSGAR